jgi:primosomal protein N' (replication factor Y)
VLSSDFLGGAERLRAQLAAVAAGSFDIVVGTQLVAKGHNFPLLTLVGVLDADIGLTSGDPRAAERTFQLLRQVTGRAGRGDIPGRALVQTFQPEHPVIAAMIAGDAERFYREETRVRESAGLPPFGRLAALVVSADERDVAEAHARAVALAAEPPPGVTVLGPAEAPLALIRGRWRFRLLVKTEREVDLQAYLRAWMARSPKPRGTCGSRSTWTRRAFSDGRRRAPQQGAAAPSTFAGTFFPARAERASIAESGAKPHRSTCRVREEEHVGESGTI